MTRRDLLASAAAPMLKNPAQAAGRKRPNIIFIYTDDQRWDAIRAIGRQPWLRTPNMDRLMREGAWFRNSFVTTSLCSPSRSSLLTGCYPHRTGVTDNEPTTRLRAQIPVVFGALREAGYATGYVGKVHVPNFLEGDRGLDFVASFPGQGRYFNNQFIVNGKATPTEGYITGHLTRYALEFLNNRDTSKPFCMYLGHKAVHANFDPDPRMMAPFEKEWMELPKTWDDPYQNKPPYLAERRKTPHGLEGMIAEYGNYSQVQRKIAACLASVDDSVGQILAHLTKTKQLDDTVIVYSSDNGFFRGEHGLWDKRAMYEDSIRVPYLVHYPRLVKPGTVFDQMVLNIDLAPTILDLAGIDRPSYMQGDSWKPILEGRNRAGRQAWLYEYFWDRPYPWDPTQFGLRTARYKYIRYPEVENMPPRYPMKESLPYDELYDLQEDPLEMRNLAHDASAGGLLQKMQDLLKGQMEAMDYPGGFR